MSEMRSFSIRVYLQGAEDATSEGMIEYISGNTKLELQRGTVQALRMEYDRIEIEVLSKSWVRDRG